jgi:hypothetical protein
MKMRKLKKQFAFIVYMSFALMVFTAIFIIIVGLLLVEDILPKSLFIIMGAVVLATLPWSYKKMKGLEYG